MFADELEEEFEEFIVYEALVTGSAAFASALTYSGF